MTVPSLKTLLASELIEMLRLAMAAHGDKPLFIRDADTCGRVGIGQDDIECGEEAFFLGHEDYTRIDY